MDILVAVDEKWGIGKDGDLLKPISLDLKRFREMTTGNVLVLGRKTLESFPNAKPLPKRDHIVLTKNKEFASEGITLCHEIADLDEKLKDFADKNIFVVGGGTIYSQLLPLCKHAYVTKIYDAYPADTYFPNLDALENWEVVEEGEILEENGVKFSFVKYTNTSL